MTDYASFDFVVRGGAPLTGLARAYGLEPSTADRGLSAGELLAQVFGAGIRIGDRATWGPVDLVVRTLTGEGQVDTVGLTLEPSRPPA